MQRIIDLHIHSHYSRATSKDMNISSLYRWGKIKGINVIGTGDFTHPLWFKELQEKLEPAELGLFKLKDEFAKEEDKYVPASCKNVEIRFVLTVEISNIYSRHDKVRKLHNLLIVPSFEVASKVNAELTKIGNLTADGRPILGLDSYELLRILLQADPNSLFIPAHIWTPWFSMFGSKSGFNTIEEAFADLTPEVKAIETGLSSDPIMNRRLSQLDNITITSNSDAHSAKKLGREATIIDSELSFAEIVAAIKTNDKRLIGTIEFFPEEGKYHYDGHRICNVCFSPEQTREHKGICPVCKKPLVIGVEYRVEEIADRDKGKVEKQVEYIIPLAEVIAETLNQNVGTKKVDEQYNKVIATFADEFTLLRNFPTKQIADAGFIELADALEKMRKKEVFVQPGYDGVYGTIKVYPPNKSKTYSQISLI